jgi:hypothetical protein
MESVYSYCAMIGGTLVLIQMAMGLVGLGGSDLDGLDAVDMDVDMDIDLDVDTDIDVGHGGVGDTWLVGMLSTRAILAAIAVFGLTGSTLKDHFTPLQATLSAMIAAGATMYAVGFLIRSMHKLTADGTVHIEDTVGQAGTVYLSVGAKKETPGKVTVRVGERTMEYPAVTAGAPLKTGTPIVVVGVLGEVLEVAHATDSEYAFIGTGSM